MSLNPPTALQKFIGIIVPELQLNPDGAQLEKLKTDLMNAHGIDVDQEARQFGYETFKQFLESPAMHNDVHVINVLDQPTVYKARSKNDWLVNRQHRAMRDGSRELKRKESKKRQWKLQQKQQQQKSGMNSDRNHHWNNNFGGSLPQQPLRRDPSVHQQHISRRDAYMVPQQQQQIAGPVGLGPGQPQHRQQQQPRPSSLLNFRQPQQPVPAAQQNQQHYPPQQPQAAHTNQSQIPMLVGHHHGQRQKQQPPAPWPQPPQQQQFGNLNMNSRMGTAAVSLDQHRMPPPPPPPQPVVRRQFPQQPPNGQQPSRHHQAQPRTLEQIPPSSSSSSAATNVQCCSNCSKREAVIQQLQQQVYRLRAGIRTLHSRACGPCKRMPEWTHFDFDNSFGIGTSSTTCTTSATAAADEREQNEEEEEQAAAIAAIAASSISAASTVDGALLNNSELEEGEIFAESWDEQKLKAAFEQRQQQKQKQQQNNNIVSSNSDLNNNNSATAADLTRTISAVAVVADDVLNNSELEEDRTIVVVALDDEKEQQQATTANAAANDEAIRHQQQCTSSNNNSNNDRVLANLDNVTVRRNYSSPIAFDALPAKNKLSSSTAEMFAADKENIGPMQFEQQIDNNDLLQCSFGAMDLSANTLGQIVNHSFDGLWRVSNHRLLDDWNSSKNDDENNALNLSNVPHDFGPPAAAAEPEAGQQQQQTEREEQPTQPIREPARRKRVIKIPAKGSSIFLWDRKYYLKCADCPRRQTAEHFNAHPHQLDEREEQSQAEEDEEEAENVEEVNHHRREAEEAVVEEQGVEVGTAGEEEAETSGTEVNTKKKTLPTAKTAAAVNENVSVDLQPADEPTAAAEEPVTNKAAYCHECRKQFETVQRYKIHRAVAKVHQQQKKLAVPQRAAGKRQIRLPRKFVEEEAEAKAKRVTSAEEAATSSSSSSSGESASASSSEGEEEDENEEQNEEQQPGTSAAAAAKKQPPKQPGNQQNNNENVSKNAVANAEVAVANGMVLCPHCLKNDGVRKECKGNRGLNIHIARSHKDEQGQQKQQPKKAAPKKSAAAVNGKTKKKNAGNDRDDESDDEEDDGQHRLRRRNPNDNGAPPVLALFCQPCGLQAKTAGGLKTHENSKKHKLKVQQLHDLANAQVPNAATAPWILAKQAQQKQHQRHY